MASRKEYTLKHWHWHWQILDKVAAFRLQLGPNNVRKCMEIDKFSNCTNQELMIHSVLDRYIFDTDFAISLNSY